MRLLISHTLRSVKDNIGQLIVIILTVTVVSAMFFVTLTIGGLFTNLQTSLQARLSGSADITVSDGIFSEALLNDYLAEKGGVEYCETYLRIPSLFRPSDNSESKVVVAEATDLARFGALHPDLKVVESYEYSYAYPEVWVGKAFAEENNLKCGETVSLYLDTYKAYRTLTVTYIFDNVGVFADSVVNNVLLDYSAAGNKGLINLANIKLPSGADKAAYIEELRLVLGDGVKVGESVDTYEVDRVVSANQRLLNIALVFVTALMLFILYTSFLVISKKRLDEMALFRAAGASRAQLTVAVLAEGLIYGVTGGVLGMALGRIGMGIAVAKVIPNFPDAVSYRAWHYILTVLFGGAVSVMSASAQIALASRRSVRNATSSAARPVKKTKPLPIVVSAISAAVFGLCAIFILNARVVFLVLTVLSALVLMYCAAPFIMQFIAYLMRLNKHTRLGGTGIRRNPLARTLSRMTGLVIVFTFIIVAIVNVIVGAVTPLNARFETDFVIESVEDGDLFEIEDKISDLYGVTGTNLYFYETCISTWDTQSREYTLYGAKDFAALKGIAPNISDAVKASFDAERNPVIITYDLQRRFGLKTGDKLRLKLKDGRDLYDEFTIVGIDYTVTANDRAMFIRRDSFRIDAKEYVPATQRIFVDTNKDVPNEDLYKQMRDIAEDKMCYVLGYEDWAYATSVGIRGVVTLLNILQVGVSLVALIGVINLTIVTLLERKREFNILRASGLDSRGYLILAVAESAVIALTGAVVGIVLSITINTLMPYFGQIIDRFPVYEVFPWSIIAVAAACVASYVIIYLLSAVFRKKKAAVERNTF